MIKSYETTYLASSRIDESGILQIIHDIKNIIISFDGKILNESQVRTINLGYPIKGEIKANLFELAFEFNSSKLEDLTAEFKKNDKILRFLLKEFNPRKIESSKLERNRKPQKVELEDIDKKIEEIFESNKKNEFK